MTHEYWQRVWTKEECHSGHKHGVVSCVAAGSEAKEAVGLSNCSPRPCQPPGARSALEAGGNWCPGGRRGGRHHCHRWCTRSWDLRHHPPRSIKRNLIIAPLDIRHNTYVILPEGAQGGDLDGAREHGAGALLQLGHKLSTVLILK